jgi:hypothetical protein
LPKRADALRVLAEHLKPYTSIPGPVGLPMVGNLLSYASMRPKAHLLWTEWAKKYGTIYQCAPLPSLPLY